MNDEIDTRTPSITQEEFERQRKRQHRLIAVGVIICLGATIGGVWWLAHHSGAIDTTADAGPPGGGPGGGGGGGRRRNGVATTVGVAVAAHADMPITLEALGTVTPTATVTVIPQVAGTVAKILFREGQVVKRGDLLATLDPRSFENARMAAEGNLKRDEATLASARLTLTRYQTLLKQDSIAAQDVDTQAALVQQLQGTVMSDQADLNTAKLNLSYANIIAPVSGRIGLRTVDIGNYVAAGSTTGVAVITVMDPIDVEFAVAQDQIPTLMKRAMADNAKLPATALDRTRANILAQGYFLTVDNRVDTTTGTVKAKAEFPNQTASLFPNQFVNVRILVDTLKDATVVPTNAVRQGANGQFVYVLNKANSTVTMRNVKVGLSSDDKIVITDGVQVGETVITEGADRLKEGATVKTPNAKSAGASGQQAKSSTDSEQHTRRKNKRAAQQS